MAYPLDTSEPIALVGSACRFAGAITSPGRLWDIACSQENLSRPVPSTRFNANAFFHKDPEHHSTTDSTNGYFLGQDHRLFDAAFFNITPKEAEAMDPQQRVLLEVVYEALESAGFTMHQYAGKSVGVFVGTMTGDYDTLSSRDDLNISQYTATGNARSILSNRVSYIFDFCGPSLTIDTACSSSLVALHQAIQSLRSGEIPMACVAGVNMMLTPEQFISESNLHMLSPTGYCRMWDAEADGYARGEGIAAMFIKPLSHALVDGDYIQAIIRETGVSSDGKTQGITRPSSAAQAALIRSVYNKTGLDPKNPSHQPQFFEAHGTGTPVGDPIEARAISEAFFGNNEANAAHAGALVKNTILVGSIKTVIGHTEGAAGLAAVLKVVQCLNKGWLIPNLHLESINPQVMPFCQNLQVVTDATPWPAPAPGHPCRGSINSFGFGGTNSHAIIEKYEPTIHNPVACLFNPQLLKAIARPLGLLASPTKATILQIALPLVVSAASPESLHEKLILYGKLLKKAEGEGGQPAILAWQLYKHQTTHIFRKVVIVDWDNPRHTQHSVNEGEVHKSANTSPQSGNESQSQGMVRGQQLKSSPKILGIFTGQGAQYEAMSKDLLGMSSVYRETVKALDKVLQACPDPPAWSIEQELTRDKATSRISTAEISQVTSCALQIGLVDFLRSIGLIFACVVGHSSGEIAAAYAAGRLTQRDAVLLSYYRGKCIHLAAGSNGVDGGMAACGLSMTEAEEFCLQPQYNSRISVAASNSPTLTTLSGDLNVLEIAMEALKVQGVFVKQIKVDKAYHSFHMGPVVQAYSQALGGCDIQLLLANNGSEWVSSVSGHLMKVQDGLEIQYWGENMLKPVLFHKAIHTAMTLTDLGGFDCVIEVGPHPVLKNSVKQIFMAGDYEPLPYAAVLDRAKQDRFAVAGFLGLMWAHFGASSVNMGQYIRDSPHPHIALSRFPVDEMPTYPWDHSQIHWRESRLSTQYHFRTHPPHELLGVRTRDDTAHALRWRNVLTSENLPWADGHKFQGQALLPASAYCAMAFGAADVALQSAKAAAAVVELSDMQFLSGIIIEPGSLGVETLFSLTVTDSASRLGREHEAMTAEFSLASIPLQSYGIVGDGMIKNVQGKMRIILLPQDSPMPRRSSEPRAETMPVRIDAFYQMMDGIGLNYTGPFRGLKTLDRRLNYAAATLDTFHPSDTTELSVSPALLDGCFQATFAAFSSPGDRALWTSFLPTTIDTMRLYKPGGWDSKQAVDRASETLVEAHLTSYQPYKVASTAAITADLCVHRSDKAWIEVEGLRVTSFAPTNPANDQELYLHTKLDVDPEVEIVLSWPYDGSLGVEVIESCERVARNLAHKTQAERDARMDEIGPFIASSRITDTLELIRKTIETNLKSLPMVLDVAVQEAPFLLHFQQHLSRVVRQIVHRYPRMNILGLTGRCLGVMEAILGGLQNSFRFCTFDRGVEPRIQRRMRHFDFSRISVGDFDLGEEEEAVAISKTGLFDMVILSTTVLGQTQKPGWSPLPALRKIRGMTRDGGFFILVEAWQRHGAGSAQVEVVDNTLTPPDWTGWLEQTDFVLCARNADQVFPFGCSLHIRQAHSDYKDMMRCPKFWQPREVVIKNLLVVGGRLPCCLALSNRVEQLMGKHCDSVSRIASLEDVSSQHSYSECTAVVMLADLEVPVATHLMDEQLAVLKRIMRPGMVMLWVTKDATEGADHTAGLGLTRTLKAEIPNLVLQVLDLMDAPVDAEVHAPVVFEAFCRLLYSQQSSHRDRATATLWSNESEIHTTGNTRFVPRVVPFQPANERLNAYRRLVTRQVDSGRTALLLKGLSNGEGSSRDGDGPVQLVPINFKFPAAPCSPVHMLVEYSSSWAMRVGSSGSGGALYLCVGRNMTSGHLTIGLSTYLASIVCLSTSSSRQLVPCAVADIKLMVAILAKVLFVSELIKTTESPELVIVNPDRALMVCLESLIPRHPGPKAAFRLHFWTTDQKLADAHDRVKYMHPWTSIKDLERALPKEWAVRAFIPKASQLWKNLTALYSGVNVGYGSPGTSDSSTKMFEHCCTELCPATKEAWDWAVETTLASMLDPQQADAVSPSLVTPAFLVNKSPCTSLAPFTIIDWAKDRDVALPIAPHLKQKALRADRTYLLVGLTRDFGQSLCRLLVEQGARYILVASRKPDPQPHWIAELNARGAEIEAITLDVTDIKAVSNLRWQIQDCGLPCLGGIINGAMVLEDRVFSNMTIQSWRTVMGPKVAGSHNLDAVFGHEDLDFFVLTSSFAAVGGHAGQSAYAVANAYMNGLAVSRHRRGKAGSVLNIGVIYGLGLLARDNRQQVYDALERDGYPPISERDLHHMFLEAIELGRARPGPGAGPMPGRLVDLTTGLSRFRENDPNPQHWHLDPRFGHLVRHDGRDTAVVVEDGASQTSLRDRAASADSALEIAKILEGDLCARMEGILQRPSGSVRGENSIVELGVDSLAAVEVRNWFFKVVEENVPVMKILGAASIRELCGQIALAIMKARS